MNSISTLKWIADASTVIGFAVYYIQAHSTAVTNSIAIFCFAFSICTTIASLTLSYIEYDLWIFPCCFLYDVQDKKKKSCKYPAEAQTQPDDAEYDDDEIIITQA